MNRPSISTLLGSAALLGFLACTQAPQSNSSTTTARPQDAVPAASINGYNVVGYMPNWQGSPSSIQYGKLTHINYAFAETSTSGALSCDTSTVSLSSIVSNAHAAGVKVIISVGGASNGSAMTSAITSSSARSTLISNIKTFVANNNLDGVDIDWEGPFSASEGTAFQSLMQSLYTYYHPLGKLVTCAVDTGDWFGMNIPSASFAYMDFANIMAYDGDGTNHSTYAFAQSALSYWAGRGLPASKMNLGVPFYGYKGTSRSSEMAYKDIVALSASAANLDSYGGYGYNGIPTIQQKTQLAMTNAAGIMIWELDEDATGSASLLSAIYTTLGGGTTTKYTITASAGTGGTISPSGSVSVTSGSSQAFTITPNSGYTISAVTVDGSNKGAISSYTFSNVTAAHTIQASFAASTGDSNIAPSGTGYGWAKNTSATSNSNKVAMAGLNDNNLTTDVDLNSAGDAVNAWEAAGVTFSSAKTVSSAKFINGTVTSGGDGFLTANCSCQYTTNGTTWVATGWTISPAYPNSSSASGKTYTFSGAALSGVLGVRIVGQVRTTDTSYHWIVKEVQVIGH